MKKLLSLLLVLLSFAVIGQKKKIDYTIYDDWKSIGKYLVSDNGKYVVFEQKPQVGNSEVIIYNGETDKTEKFFARGSNPYFIGNDYILYTEKFDYDSLRQLKLAKTKKDKLPKNRLVLVSINKMDSVHSNLFESFQISEEGNILAWLSTELEKDPCYKSKRKCKKCKKKRSCKKKKNQSASIDSLGNTLFYVDLSQKDTFRIRKIHYVKSFELSKDGKLLVYTNSIKIGKEKILDCYGINPKSGERKLITKDEQDISKINISEHSKYVAFLSSQDTSSRKSGKIYDLSLWNAENQKQAKIIVNHKDLDTTKSVSKDRNIFFSIDQKRLFYGIGKKPEEDVKDTLLDKEKVKLDLWSWQDNLLQPQQLKRAKREQNKSNLFVYDLNKESAIQLENDTMRWSYGLDLNRGKYGLVSNDEAYQKSFSWEMPWPRDLYLVDMETGAYKTLKKHSKFDMSIDKDAKRMVWWEAKDSNFYSKDLANNQVLNLSSKMNEVFASDNNGMPFEPYSRGILGFDKDGDKVYLQGKFDIWTYNFKDNSIENLTISGRKDSTQYKFHKLNYDSAYVYFDDIMLLSHDYKTHDAFLYQFDGKNKLKLAGGPHRFYGMSRSKNKEKFVTRWGNVKTYPDLIYSDQDFAQVKQISFLDEQSKDYNWATVESFFWTTPKGKKLEGLVYKPEDFDQNKKYPLMVYFYETYAKTKHTHYAPRPTASIVFPTEYASNGYIVFIPDISYEEGHPAQSAYDCIVSGTDSLTKKYKWIDTTKMALQGQSWGGYQSAQLITMTNKYKCAMAGAPVSNMFSAYGGIRWGSGMSRMFQYERTQSRIGATIWEKPELYIENSPIFGLPKVNTPLLIMHNDGDGAVPWYQGIEMFVGLRRLNKPVWMMNYNGDQHNLMKRANRMDLSRRMRSFFDYYLLDAPLPKWMKDGIPAVDKGKKFGFETE